MLMARIQLTVQEFQLKCMREIFFFLRVGVLPLASAWWLSFAMK